MCSWLSDIIHVYPRYIEILLAFNQYAEGATTGQEKEMEVFYILTSKDKSSRAWMQLQASRTAGIACIDNAVNGLYTWYTRNHKVT